MVTRTVALTELPIRGSSTNEDADNVTAISVVASDSGLLFINKETSGTVTYTLPTLALAAGKWFWFMNAQTSFALAITGGTASKIVYSNSTTASTVTCATQAGECGMIYCDGVNYYFFEIYGSWS